MLLTTVTYSWDDVNAARCAPMAPQAVAAPFQLVAVVVVAEGQACLGEFSGDL